MTPSGSGNSLLHAVAAYGLAGSPPLPSEPLGDDAFRRVVGQCGHHRVLGLLGAAVRAGDFPLSPSQREYIERELQSWLAHALRIERLALDARERLGEHGIEALILKGAALAHEVYPDPAWRVFGDADLLIEPGRFTHSARVLEDRFGVTRALPELRPGFDDRFGREILLRVGPLELDLHRTLVDGAFGLMIELDDLHVEPRPFQLAGRQAWRLGSEQLLLHACYNAALGDWPPRLAAQRDVAQILTALDPDPDSALRMADRWRGTAVIALGLAGAWERLGLREAPPLVDWARRYRIRPLDRLLISAYQGPARGPASQVASVLVIRGASRKLAYLQAIAWPRRVYLQRRQLNRCQFLGKLSGAFRRMTVGVRERSHSTA